MGQEEGDNDDDRETEIPHVLKRPRLARGHHQHAAARAATNGEEEEAAAAKASSRCAHTRLRQRLFRECRRGGRDRGRE